VRLIVGGVVEAHAARSAVSVAPAIDDNSMTIEAVVTRPSARAARLAVARASRTGGLRRESP
jgi:hypothetical protein